MVSDKYKNKLRSGIEGRNFKRLARFLSLLRYCEKKGIPFNIEYKDFIHQIELRCNSCKHKDYAQLNNLILIDFSKHYTLDNVRTICDRCLKKIKT